jgi:LPXTG-motif cell wall-anchored protein
MMPADRHGLLGFLMWGFTFEWIGSNWYTYYFLGVLSLVIGGIVFVFIWKRKK